MRFVDVDRRKKDTCVMVGDMQEIGGDKEFIYFKGATGVQCIGEKRFVVMTNREIVGAISSVDCIMEEWDK